MGEKANGRRTQTDQHPFRSGRIWDDPVVVVDTTWSYPRGCWVTLAISPEARLASLQPIRSDSWMAAEEAHLEMTRLCFEMLKDLARAEEKRV